MYSAVTWSSGDTITEVKLDQMTANDVSFRDGTGFADGMPVQMNSLGYSSVATGTTVLPSDTSTPQSNEGDQYMTLAITPKSATNILVIDIVAYLSHSVANTKIGVALFTAGADALAATQVFAPATATGMVTIPLTHRMVAGTTSALTFYVRCGGADGGTTTFNGQGGNVRMGTAVKSSIKITEYVAS